MLCRAFKCLPSQLEREDSKTIELFGLILNEIEAQKEDKARQLENEMRLKGR